MALELQETLQQLEKVKGENTRWQRVCMKMKYHLDRLIAKEEGGEEGDEPDVPDGAMIHSDGAEIAKKKKIKR